MTADPLTARQRDALRAYVRADGNVKAAAAELGLSRWTVHQYLREAREAVGAGSTAILVLRYADELRERP